MRLSILLRISYPLLKDLLCLLYELPMQVNSVVCDSAWCIVLPEDEVRRLLVVLIHFCSMLLAFLGELVRSCPVAILVCLL